MRWAVQAKKKLTLNDVDDQKTFESLDLEDQNNIREMGIIDFQK